VINVHYSHVSKTSHNVYKSILILYYQEINKINFVVEFVAFKLTGSSSLIFILNKITFHDIQYCLISTVCRKYGNFFTTMQHMWNANNWNLIIWIYNKIDERYSLDCDLQDAKMSTYSQKERKMIQWSNHTIENMKQQ
jgi:hypothetical protein